MAKPWKWTRRFSIALSAGVAVFSAWWFVAPFLPMAQDVSRGVGAGLLALIVGSSQGLANCMAANARRIHGTGRHGVSWRVCVALWAVFATVSWFGLHNGWAMAQAAAPGYAFPADWIMEAMFLGVAISEPAMNWVVDLLKAMAKDEEAEEDRRVRDEAMVREEKAWERRGKFSVVGMGAAALAMASPALPTEEAHAFPLEPVTHENPMGETAAHHAHGWTGPKDQTRWELVKLAVARGMTPKEIHEETGVPLTTVYRWRSMIAA